ncbi:ADP-ribose pyrophosphatase [Saccharibacillus sp. O23]|uniref:NUDIX hydrolase n=1 Tax=Saccharibacillus sp. O23 TaxID=2009338 RepID=UPI000B4E7F9B|nr:NUDIX hydrolase [Saccharibacillus sp. O23]OWR27190.1 ADP-ribose pyrophosphatase [Saccharibacillus sp. O23]
MQPKWLEWAKQIQAISQAGLEYSRDAYDLERFEMLRTLSVEIMSEYTGVDTKQIRELFAGESGYATPKVDVRGVIFREERILLVRERLDGAWSLPGGWADIGLSAKENVVKEIREETGYEASAGRLLAVLDKKFHEHPVSPFHVYKFFFRCEITGGEAAETMETSEVGFFAENELPPLSQERNTDRQVREMFEYLRDPERPAWLD